MAVVRVNATVNAFVSPGASVSDDGLTTVVTNQLRTQGTTMYADEAGRGPRALAVGDVLSTTVCTEFSWPWLLLPTALLALSVLLLVMMMVRNHADGSGQPVWKSSLLPLLFHGFAYPTLSAGALNKEQLEKAAEGLEFQFQTGKGPGEGAPGFVRSTPAANPGVAEEVALMGGR